MKICVLHSASEGRVEDTEGLWSDPGLYIAEHTFEHRFIKKDTAEAQIDAAVAEGFDFYINFMWGMLGDNFAGIAAIKYLESLHLPFAGIRSFERERTKYQFYVEARRLGTPAVPGNTNFPLFVRPAIDYASQLVNEHSICHTEEELEFTIRRLHGKMRDSRVRRARALGVDDPDRYVRECEAAGRNSSDLVVQEFIDGEEYAVAVLAMGDVPVPLSPQVVKHTKRLPGKEQFLTFDVKFDSGTTYELLDEENSPELYRHLQDTAVEAFRTCQMHTTRTGCDVDLRVGSDGTAYVIEVDPLPVYFLPVGSLFEDKDVVRDLPGGYRAAVNIFITNYSIHHPEKRADKRQQLAEFHDQEAPWYDTLQLNSSIILEIAGTISGSVLDLGCGTGVLGHILRGNQQEAHRISRLIGVDVSSGMLNVCRQGGWYDDVILEDMLRFLAHYNTPVDHVFCLSTLHFFSAEELDFILARCFLLAKRSIILTIDESFDSVRTHMKQNVSISGYFTNHVNNTKSFVLPRSWDLSSKTRCDSSSTRCATTFIFTRRKAL
ncbi:hypothetical protein ANOM_002310 [Aspergillus nomiae NRRL 13137]|uniref:ATP-grasp domain-containing protein n=1 Tax=Aspergillus nomiae NRRL (strain ATCC 15546 / NRRL 13137 / CBS 260.88 / M93) TaxID=1509407 RepID=A0A0L1JE17_ASPN3|nr:uncharacterized protein ANOM_002310 [Aspergillus nomiae NRRL 13137]KNG89678.1 hypothetical protein ANOM_002310 [Aspergillus nomiae NRRL 13137]